MNDWMDPQDPSPLHCCATKQGSCIRLNYPSLRATSDDFDDGLDWEPVRKQNGEGNQVGIVGERTMSMTQH